MTSTSNTDTVINVLQNIFSADNGEKEKYLSISKQALKRGLQNRVFNHFPTLLSPNSLIYFKHQLMNLIAQIAHNTDFKIYPGNKFACEKWIKQLTKKAIQEIIDSSTLAIKTNLVDLLEWEDFQTELKTFDIVYAFIVNICMALVADKEISAMYRVYPKIKKFIFPFINQNCQIWVNKTLESKGIPNELNACSTTRWDALFLSTYATTSTIAGYATNSTFSIMSLAFTMKNYAPNLTFFNTQLSVKKSFQASPNSSRAL